MPATPLRLSLRLFVAALTGALVLGGCARGLGKKPSARLKATYAASPNFDPARGEFVNLPEPVLDSFWVANRARFRAGVNVSLDGDPPDYSLPMAKPDFAAFGAGDSGLKMIWIGHSALALRLDGVVILLDPIFGRSSPLSFYEGPRFQPPPFQREELPPVDVIVISHDHYDHLERATVEHYAKRNTKFLVPLGVSSHLRYWGVPKENIIERDWWETASVKGVEFTATPSWHASGRLERGSRHTQWASWVIRSGGRTLYFSGDTGYGRHFQAIGERFGPFDLVFLETGQYSRAWRTHLQPHHWPVVLRELRSENWFPIHWGTFSFAPHAWDEPIRAADSIARERGLRLWTPKMGEVVDADAPPEFSRWWERPAADAKTP